MLLSSILAQSKKSKELMWPAEPQPQPQSQQQPPNAAPSLHTTSTTSTLELLHSSTKDLRVSCSLSIHSTQQQLPSTPHHPRKPHSSSAHSQFAACRELSAVRHLKIQPHNNLLQHSTLTQPFRRCLRPNLVNVIEIETATLQDPKTVISTSPAVHLARP